MMNDSNSSEKGGAEGGRDGGDGVGKQKKKQQQQQEEGQEEGQWELREATEGGESEVGESSFVGAEGVVSVTGHQLHSKGKSSDNGAGSAHVQTLQLEEPCSFSASSPVPLSESASLTSRVRRGDRRGREERERESWGKSS